MAIDERRRYELYLRAEEVLGSEPADSLMQLLPPAGTDVATRQDVEAMGASLRQEMAAMGHEIVATMRAALHAQARAMFVAIVTIVLTMSGLTFGLVSTLAR